MPEWLINLKSSSGKEIIRENHDVFPRGVSSLFELNGCSIPSLPAPAVKAALFKVVRPNLLWALEGFGVDYNSLCLSQGQIIDFARRYPHFVGHGYGTWILFKVNLGFFFATLHTYSGNDPNIDVCSLSEMEKNYCVDYKGCTLVIPFRR
jgi:hypothetical protein